MASPDLSMLYAQLVGQLGSPAEIETPQLGRVVNMSAANIAVALNLLRQEAVMAAGIATTGVINIGYKRGLGGECL